MEAKLERIKEAKELLPQQELLRAIENSKNAARDFKHRISHPHKMNLIAELKRSSPSAGTLRKDFNPVMLAEIFEASGADALSILTEEDFFKGELSYIAKVKASCDLPVLRKDFVVDAYQIYESRYYGADALLLIADLLSEDEIRRFVEITSGLGMCSMIEVHSEEDLKKALSAGAEIIGINNRNLHTFEVKLETTERLMNFIPKGKVVVSESGIQSASDVAYLASLGVNAVLIGEAFMKAADIKSKIEEMMGYK